MTVISNDSKQRNQDEPHFDDVRANLPHEPSVNPHAAHEGTDDLAGGAVQQQFRQPNERDDDIQGVELKEYAKRDGISVDALWRRIRRGELVARTENGFVYVYGSRKSSTPMSSPNGERTDGTPVDFAEGLPPLPVDYENPHSSNLPALPNDSRAVSEVALLLDHLSVAKEESRQVLKLSEESINRITQMSEAIVKAKDELIAQQNSTLLTKDKSLNAYEEEIAELRQRLDNQDEENRRLKQEVEDLEMLTKTLGGETLA